MAASCAVCLTPIRRGESFAIDGTEAVHRRCLGGKTAGTRHTLMAIEIKRQNLELTAEVCHLRETYEPRIAELEKRLRAMREGRDLASDDAGKALSDMRAMKIQRDEARRDRDAANAARDAARREAQLHQTIQGSTSPIVATANPEPASDDRDASEIRFSLLEIDKP